MRIFFSSCWDVGVVVDYLFIYLFKKSVDQKCVAVRIVQLGPSSLEPYWLACVELGLVGLLLVGASLSHTCTNGSIPAPLNLKLHRNTNPPEKYYLSSMKWQLHLFRVKLVHGFDNFDTLIILNSNIYGSYKIEG